MSLTSSPESCSTPFLRVTNSYPKRAIPELFAPEYRSAKGAIGYQLQAQLMAADTESFKRVAHELLTVTDNVELNCGCPSPNAVGSAAGSSLLRDIDAFSSFLDSLVSDLGENSLAVKMRTGFTSHYEFPSLIKLLTKYPLKHLSIHGRTRDQRYDGLNQWDLIYWAVKRCSYNVYASGDILSYKDYAKVNQSESSLAGVLIGRGALRNPWIFDECRQQDQVVMNKDALRYSLLVFALLYYTSLHHPQKLLGMVNTGIFLDVCGTDPSKWEKVYSLLTRNLDLNSDWEHMELPRNILGRVKMMWGYMRSSFPPHFFNPRILRSSSLPQLISGISGFFQEDHGITMKHRPEYDWIYTSRKKQPRETAKDFGEIPELSTMIV